jgi:hypothetical protein
MTLALKQSLPEHSLSQSLTLVADKLESYLLEKIGDPSVVVRPHQYGLSFLRSSLLMQGNASDSRPVKYVESRITAASTGNYACGEFLWYPHWVSPNSSGEMNLAKPAWPLKFKNTDVANWQLLKLIVVSAVKRHAANSLTNSQAVSKKIDRCVTAIARRYGWSADGFLSDELHTSSFSYHTFSASLLADLADLGSPLAQHWFDRAAELCKCLIAPDGQVALLGRGQEQIFAYGSMLSVLVRRILASDLEVSELAMKVVGRLIRFQDESGNVPLLLRDPPHGQEVEFDASKLTEKAYAGWYAYNTPWDYQPFLLWQLRRCAKLLSDSHTSLQHVATTKNIPEVSLPEKIVVRRRHGQFLLAATPTCGYWADGQPTPWISDFPLPLCGADHLDGDFHASQLPLPGGEIRHMPIWYRGLSYAAKIQDRFCESLNFRPYKGHAFDFWQQLTFEFAGDNRLLGRNSLVDFERSFQWKSGELSMTDQIYWKRSLHFRKFSPVRFAASSFQSFAGGWEVNSRIPALRGALRITSSVLDLLPKSCWTTQDIVTADGAAQLLIETKSDYRAMKGDTLERVYRLTWSPRANSTSPNGYKKESAETKYPRILQTPSILTNEAERGND